MEVDQIGGASATTDVTDKAATSEKESEENASCFGELVEVLY